MTRATPENPQETASAGSSETIRQPSRARLEMKRWSDPYGDVGRSAETTDPPPGNVQPSWSLSNSFSEIPCRVDELPLEGVIPLATPANNGEALPPDGAGNPVGSRERQLFDPVTTEVERPRWSSLSQDKSMDSIRRRPFEPMLDIPSYVSGYVDGEGCFCISLRPQPRIKVGWEVRPSFSVSQNEDRAGVIRLLPHLFGGGSIRPDRSDRTLKFEVRSLKTLVEAVIPFFETWPLLSSKRTDFEIFSSVCRRMQQGIHLTPEGIILISELAEQMNPSGLRRYSTEMIRESFQR